VILARCELPIEHGTGKLTAKHPQMRFRVTGIMASQTEKLSRQAYWKANLKLVGWCLLIWATVSYGFGILLVEPLNQFHIFGFKLGFWFAQQGSIYVFLLLIFFYTWRMNILDRRFGVDETERDEEDLV